MPTTLPAAFSTGPPELPWFTAASVWIDAGRRKADPRSGDLPVELGDDPVESDARFSNGLPITAIGSPTRSSARMPEWQRVQSEMRRIHLKQRRVLEEVVAEHAPSARVPSPSTM